jgi:hypothetical protein
MIIYQKNLTFLKYLNDMYKRKQRARRTKRKSRKGKAKSRIYRTAKKAAMQVINQQAEHKITT